MAPSFLFDISQIDMTQVVRDASVIESVNPHRGHMRLVDGIIYEDIPAGELVAYKDIRDDEFWVAGHIPGRPIFPGVLMIEAAAQLASYCYLQKQQDHSFMGFVGVEKTKFRGQVVPGDKLIVVMKEVELRRRRSISDVQGLVDGKLVFETQVHGMPM